MDINVYKRLQTETGAYIWLMERKCQECGETLNGRIDKRFCDDQCRSTYYNRSNGAGNNLMRRINGVLKKNRRILESLNPNGKAVVSAKEMLDKGYNFSYHTNSYTTKNGNTYFFCYEYGYLVLEDKRVSLVIKEDWVDQR